jgi:NADH-quinone oxidoreductase subunit C
MDSTLLVRTLRELLPNATVEESPPQDRHVTLYVDRDAVPDVMRALRDQAALRFTAVVDVTAIDFWPREPRFELVYLLISLEHRCRVRIKVRLHGADAHVATVSGIWPAANWLEREVWDLFGIVFDDHPDPRRLLMPEDWEGFPLRKDYPVQIRMAPRTTEPMQVSAEEFRANLERDRLSRR